MRHFNSIILKADLPLVIYNVTELIADFLDLSFSLSSHRSFSFSLLNFLQPALTLLVLIPTISLLSLTLFLSLLLFSSAIFPLLFLLLLASLPYSYFFIFYLFSHFICFSKSTMFTTLMNSKTQCSLL